MTTVMKGYGGGAQYRNPRHRVLISMKWTVDLKLRHSNFLLLLRPSVSWCVSITRASVANLLRP